MAASLRSIRGDVLETQPLTDHGILIANPPYGERIGEQDELATFYPQLGTALKRHWAGWNCFFFTADLRLPKLVGLKAEPQDAPVQRAAGCRLFEIRVVAGSNRKAANVATRQKLFEFDLGQDFGLTTIL